MTIVHNLRQHNRERVMRTLLNSESMSRTDVAGALGLSKVTTTSIVNALIQENFIIETAKSGNGTGRPAGLVELHPKAGTVVGIDIQTNAVSVLFGDLSGKQTQLETYAVNDRKNITKTVLNTLKKLQLEQAHGALRQVVMAVPAPVTLDGKISSPNRLPELNTNLIRTWAQQASIQIRFENDINLATLAEFEQGAGMTSQNFALLSERGGGVALGLFIEGQLYKGAAGQAGELALIGWSHQGSLCSVEELPLETRELALAQVCSVVAVVLDLELFLVHQHAGGAATLNVADRIREFVLKPVTVTASHYQDEGTVRGAFLQSVRLARDELLASI
jgi:ROK family